MVIPFICQIESHGMSSPSTQRVRPCMTKGVPLTQQYKNGSNIVGLASETSQKRTMHTAIYSYWFMRCSIRATPFKTVLTQIFARTGKNN